MGELLSHTFESGAGFDKALAELRGRLDSFPQHRDLLEKLCQFELGRFLVEHRGIDGYWTDVVVNHPERGRVTGVNAQGEPLSLLERQILDQAPTFLATQQRYQIFRKQLQKELPKARRLLSVPSGLMSELLSLDYSGSESVQLIAVDLDSSILQRVQENAKSHGFNGELELVKADAWDFTLDQPVDLITSNGLNIYVAEDDRVEALYRQFYRVLKPRGRLVASFLTPPESWDMDKIDPEALSLQKSVFADLLGVNWQQYRSEQLTRQQLQHAGFSEIEFIYDEARMFPTVVASRLD
ncbi:class I SAM-dependent methyltransferase [Dongshaea marina]|uniref:class I SAM-dependent methyltransferase n=1 Tax=Dongshaea marina TaxID=2047966 RepID=UPI000D3E6E7F|nr:class I SAM-dependent methyltransferase [Dongshaea marina]